MAGVRIARRVSCIVVTVVAIVAVVGGAAKPPEAEAANGLYPLLDCVTYDEVTDTVTAQFGFSNTNGTTMTVDISDNYFDPPPEYRDQPQTFQPGTYHDVFDATFPAGFDGDGFLTWHLSGSSVTARNDPNLYCKGSGTPDTTPPDTAILEGPRGTVGNSTATFDLFSEGGARFACRLDGADFADCTTPLELTGLGDGPHTLDVRATDESGNTDPTPASRTWTVDTTGPAAPAITAPADGSADRDGSFNVRGTAEPGSIVRLYENGSRVGTSETDPLTGAWTVGVVDIAEGPHAYRARATDGSGNVSAETDPLTVTVDRTAPVVTRVSPRGGAKASRNAVVTAQFSEPVAWQAADSAAAFTLVRSGSGRSVPATVTYDPSTRTATLDPSRKLRAGARYRARVTTDVRDDAGNPLAAPRSWSFSVRR